MAEQPTTGDLSLRGVARALLDPLGLVVLGGTGLAFAATQLVPVVALGGLSWATLVALKLVSGAREPRAPSLRALPEVDAFMDADVKSRITALHHVRSQLERVLRESPKTVTEHMEPALAGVPELEEHAVRLARRAEDLGDYLRTQDRASIARESKRLEQAAAKAVDPSAREEYARAVSAVGEQLLALDDIVSARDRALANLSRIVSTLESLPPRLVRMRAMDATAQDALGDDTSADLSRLNEEIRLFEKTLSSLAEPGAGQRSTP